MDCRTAWSTLVSTTMGAPILDSRKRFICTFFHILAGCSYNCSAVDVSECVGGHWMCNSVLNIAGLVPVFEEIGKDKGKETKS